MLDFANQTSSYAQSQARTKTYDSGLANYMQKVFNNMGIAIAISGFVSFFVANTPAIMQLLFANKMLSLIVMFSPLAFIFFMSSQANKATSAQLRTYLWIFASLMGLSLAPIFLIYTGHSIARAFFIASSLFFGMSFYGYVTKKDLTSMGSFLIMGVWGIFIAAIVNMFILKSSALSFAISVLTVLIFTGLTAYDTQRIKSIYYQFAGNTEAVAKASIMGALNLYIDFINIFIALLRLTGAQRD